MWKEGESLIIHDKDVTLRGRIFNNFIGSLFFLFLAGMVMISMYPILFDHEKFKIAHILGVICLSYLAYLIAKLFIYESYFAEDSPIVIGSLGILASDKTLYKWHDIEYAFFGVDDKSGSKKGRDKFLHILYRDTNNEKCSVKLLLNFSVYDREDIARAVEYWSGRDIGEKTDLIRDEYIQDLVDKGKMEESEAKQTNEKISRLTPFFRGYYNKVIKLGLCMLPILFAAGGILFLLDTPTPYDNERWYYWVKVMSLTLGSLAIFFVPVILIDKTGKKILKKHPEIKRLSEDEFTTYLAIAIEKPELIKGKQKEDIIEQVAISLVIIFAFLWLAYAIFLSFYKFGILS